MMGPRERILASIRLEEADRVPLFELALSEVLIEGILGEQIPAHLLTETTAEEASVQTIRRATNAHARIGLDGIGFFALTNASNNKPLENGCYIDEWGRIFSRKIRAGTMSDFYVGGSLKTPELYEAFPRPDSHDQFRIEQYRKCVKAAGEEIYIIPTAGSIYEYPVRGVGDWHICKYAYTNPSFLNRVFRDSAYYTKEVGKAFIDEGAEVLFIFEDYAYKHGPFLSPKHWRRYVYPHLKDVTETFHKRGVLVLVHSDGNILSLLDMIAEAGVDGIHSLEPAAGINLSKVKEKIGDRLCLIGNIDVSNLLPYGTRKQVEIEVRKAIVAAAPGGGYILSTCSAPTDACTPENYSAYIQTGRKYGKYTSKKIAHESDT